MFSIRVRGTSPTLKQQKQEEETNEDLLLEERLKTADEMK
jgi:hypothetical protein